MYLGGNNKSFLNPPALYLWSLLSPASTETETLKTDKLKQVPKNPHPTPEEDHIWTWNPPGGTIHSVFWEASPHCTIFFLAGHSDLALASWSYEMPPTVVWICSLQTQVVMCSLQDVAPSSTNSSRGGIKRLPVGLLCVLPHLLYEKAVLAHLFWNTATRHCPGSREELSPHNRRRRTLLDPRLQNCERCFFSVQVIQAEKFLYSSTR